jgi:hypothetical protein
MARYTRPALSPKANERVGAFFRICADLAETFVFIYIGLALFTDRARRTFSSGSPLLRCEKFAL